MERNHTKYYGWCISHRLNILTKNDSCTTVPEVKEEPKKQSTDSRPFYRFHTSTCVLQSTDPSAPMSEIPRTCGEGELVSGVHTLVWRSVQVYHEEDKGREEVQEIERESQVEEKRSRGHDCGDDMKGLKTS